MKKLTQFTRFDWAAFAQDKTFQVTGIRPRSDSDDRQRIIGSTVDVVIIRDDTQYQCKPGESVTNLFEKLSIKLPQAKVAVQLGDYVQPVNATAKTADSAHLKQTVNLAHEVSKLSYCIH